MKHWWLMNVDGPWRLRYVRAERPCWKGEVQIGRLVFGWHRRDQEVATS